METIISNENLKQNIEELKEQGSKYIVKANDKMLSYWGNAENKKHIQLIACKTIEEKDTILRDLEQDNNFNYIDWQFINNYKGIYNYTKGKSFTIRNDWTRCF